MNNNREMNKLPKFYYNRYMGGYSIYRRNEPVNGVTTATKIGRKWSEEEAKKLVYKLNGWKWKE